MKHQASPTFWERYESLPEAVRRVSDKSFALLKENPSHPSLRFKRVGRFYSVRVGRSHRALGVEAPAGVLWFWIGSHADYDRIVGYNARQQTARRRGFGLREVSVRRAAAERERWAVVPDGYRSGSLAA